MGRNVAPRIDVAREIWRPRVPARHRGAMRLAVKVVPKASRAGLVGWMDDALKVRVTAAPERGRANEAVRATLAAALGVAPDRVRLVAGHASPRKIFEIDDLDEAEARRRIDAALGD